jgi:mevalonate kinase
MIKASAPGKIILFGEHAVVYGRPAIAAPLSQVRATAVVVPNKGEGVRIIAPDMGANFLLDEADGNNALVAAMRQIQAAARLESLPNLTVTVRSDIPIASHIKTARVLICMSLPRS